MKLWIIAEVEKSIPTGSRSHLSKELDALSSDDDLTFRAAPLLSFFLLVVELRWSGCFDESELKEREKEGARGCWGEREGDENEDEGKRREARATASIFVGRKKKAIFLKFGGMKIEETFPLQSSATGEVVELGLISVWA